MEACFRCNWCLCNISSIVCNRFHWWGVYAWRHMAINGESRSSMPSTTCSVYICKSSALLKKMFLQRMSAFQVSLGRLKCCVLVSEFVFV